MFGSEDPTCERQVWSYHFREGHKMITLLSPIRDRIQITSELVDDLRPALTRSKTPERILTLVEPKEHYAVQVLGRVTDVLEHLDSLREVIYYLGHYPSSSTYKIRGPKRHQWYRYHIENFYTRLRGIKDRLINLVAEIYCIKPAKNETRPSYNTVFRKDPRVSKGPLQSLLDSFNNRIVEYKALRDEVVHEHSYTDEQLRIMGMFTLVLEEGVDVEVDPNWPIHLSTIVFKHSTIPKLEALLTAVEEDCFLLITELGHVYSDQKHHITFTTT